MRYRVRVDSYVVVDAKNASDAKARAELALRRVVKRSYGSSDDEGLWGDGWGRFGFNAKKAERMTEDD